jgi:hypothetical protein
MAKRRSSGTNIQKDTTPIVLRLDAETLLELAQQSIYNLANAGDCVQRGITVAVSNYPEMGPKSIYIRIEEVAINGTGEWQPINGKQQKQEMNHER